MLSFMCCHSEMQTFYLTQSQFTDTGPTSASVDSIMPAGLTRPGERSTAKAGIKPRSAALGVDILPLGQQGGAALVTLWATVGH